MEQLDQSQGSQAVKRYTHIVLRRMPPLNGFSIKTPEAKFLSDIRPRGIVRELNRMADRIKRLEEAGDALASWTIPNGNSHVDWRKAKEAKL